MNKKLIIGVIVLVIILVLVMVKNVHSTKPASSTSTDSNTVNLVSTSPSPLDEGTVLPNQTISLTFDHSAQNIPELKMDIEPKADWDIKLSGDRKTVTITPKSPLPLKQGYTLYIPADAKFDPNITLGKDITIHFTTIDYQGV